MHLLLDGVADPLEVVEHLEVGEPQDVQAEPLQVGGALEVVGAALGREVGVAVEFDHQLCAGAVEVGDVLPDGALFEPALWVLAQEVEPELALGGGQVFAELLGLGHPGFEVGEVAGHQA